MHISDYAHQKKIKKGNIHMTTKTNIGSALTALRTGNHLTIQEAAKHLKTTPASYSNYERGRSYPDLKLLFHAAIYYHINIEFLIFLTCIDLASFENLKNEELFQLFTYGHTFSWDFFQLFEQYNTLSDAYKEAAATFLEAAASCNKQ